MAVAATPLAPRPYDAELERQYSDLYQVVRAQISPLDWQQHLPYIDAIRALKTVRRAVVLAHNYQPPEIFHTVADICGDSLALAQRVYIINNGHIVHEGPALEIKKQPDTLQRYLGV